MQNRCHEQGTADEHVDPSRLYRFAIAAWLLEDIATETDARAQSCQLDQPQPSAQAQEVRGALLDNLPLASTGGCGHGITKLSAAFAAALRASPPPAGVPMTRQTWDRNSHRLQRNAHSHRCCGIQSGRMSELTVVFLLTASTVYG